MDLKPAGMPANTAGVGIDPQPYNASDGFSQGSTIVLRVPGIDTVADVKANELVPINHIGRYADADQRVVVIDARTGERWPIWAEIDSNASDPANAALEIHPATNFASGGRYIVALRGLERSDGTPIEAPAAFRYFRDDVPSEQEEIDRRRAAYEEIFKGLRGAGIRRDSLYLAWDFTVASDQNGYSRSLAMRDQAFATLGDTTMGDRVVQGVAPPFSVTSVQSFTPAENSRIARRITGTYDVPCFMVPDCGPGRSPTSIPAASRAATGPGRRRLPARFRERGSTPRTQSPCARTSSGTACSAT